MNTRVHIILIGVMITAILGVVLAGTSEGLKSSFKGSTPERTDGTLEQVFGQHPESASRANQSDLDTVLTELPTPVSVPLPEAMPIPPQPTPFKRCLIADGSRISCINDCLHQNWPDAISNCDPCRNTLTDVVCILPDDRQVEL